MLCATETFRKIIRLVLCAYYILDPNLLPL